jgi:hypothetical protein
VGDIVSRPSLMSWRLLESRTIGPAEQRLEVLSKGVDDMRRQAAYPFLR